jgi:hypothetical protein
LKNSQLTAGNIPAISGKGHQDVQRISSDPLRQVDRFVDAAVKPDEDAAGLVAGILDRVPITLWDIRDVALLKVFRPEPAV